MRLRIKSAMTDGGVSLAIVWTNIAKHNTVSANPKADCHKKYPGKRISVHSFPWVIY